MQYKIFGCKVNKYYLNKRLQYFEQDGQKHDHDFLVATCVVTDRAKNKRLRDVREALEDGKRVFLTGCGAFDEGEKISDEQFYTIYPDLLPHKDLITLLGEEPGRDDAREVSSHQVASGQELYTKKFVMIQNGCDSFCSFCLTVQKRGRHRSRSQQEIIEEIHEFEDFGGKEIVLTGINLCARGADSTNNPQSSQFSSLLKAILRETDIPRIRISSLGPEFLDDDFFEIIKNPRFLPHFHFSIQSFSDSVLKNMNRHYDTVLLDDVLTRIRQLDRKDKDIISIGADIITGFPGETEDKFQKTYDALATYNITKLHAFPFSAHEQGDSVPAGKLADQIPYAERKARNAKIIQEGNRIRDEFISLNKGISHHVLLEEQKKGKWHGWTGNYLPAEIEGEHHRGEIVKILY